MPGCHHPNTSRSFSVGETQLVATRDRVVLDMALADLSLEKAIRLREVLGEAIAFASETHRPQPGLWSDAAMRAWRRPRA